MPLVLMDHDVDPKKNLQDKLGDLANIELYHNQVLVAVYQRPEKTKSGIYLTDQHRDEDRFQSKVGLIVKTGPEAFKDPQGGWSWGDIKQDDWAFYRPSDGFNVTVMGPNGESTLCRILVDTSIKGKIAHPDMVW